MQKDVCIVIADPPWAWSGGKKKAPKYDTMKLSDIMELAPAVKEISGKDCLMLMWVTIPTLEQGMALLATWGFSYKSAHIWRKRRHGTGFYSRNNAEIVLIGRRGRPGCPQKGKQGLTIFDGEPLDKRHSSKPKELHEWVERHYPYARKVELFARNLRAGWDCVGYDVGSALTPNGVVRTVPNGKDVDVEEADHDKRITGESGDACTGSNTYACECNDEGRGKDRHQRSNAGDVRTDKSCRRESDLAG